MRGLSSIEEAAIALCAEAPLLDQVTEWAAVNSGSRNLAGLDSIAHLLAGAFSALPGEATLREPAPVEAIGTDGAAVASKR